MIDAKTGEVVQELANVGVFVCKEGQRWVTIGSGGGGFGDPLERDPEKVRWDAREGFTSLEAARQVYGVVLKTEAETYKVDAEATRKLREELKRKR